MRNTIVNYFIRDISLVSELRDIDAQYISMFKVPEAAVIKQGVLKHENNQRQACDMVSYCYHPKDDYFPITALSNVGTCQ